MRVSSPATLFCQYAIRPNSSRGLVHPAYTSLNSTLPLVITKIGLNYPHGITLRFVCLSCTGEKSKIRVWKKERRVLSIEVVLCHRAELFKNDRHFRLSCNMIPTTFSLTLRDTEHRPAGFPRKKPLLFV